MSHFDLFCIPYAGGSASAIYGKWVQHLDPKIKVHPLELAGHGRRMSEPFHSSVKSAVADMMETIRTRISERPYAVYGHSMGTVFAYELAVAVHASGLPQPRVLFLSGRQAPHYIYKDRDMHLLPASEFIKKIERIGGTPRQLFESEELVKIFLPILRDDYRLIEQYRFQPPGTKLDADIVFFLSDNDHLVDRLGVLEWRRYTTRSFELHDFKGGHFFINEKGAEICDTINRKLKSYLAYSNHL